MSWEHALFSSALALTVTVPASAQPGDPALAVRVERVLNTMPVIDGHNDLPWEIRERFDSDPTRVDLAKSIANLPLQDVILRLPDICKQ